MNYLRVMTVEGVTPGAGDSSLGDDSLDAGPVSQSSSPTVYMKKSLKTLNKHNSYEMYVHRTKAQICK